MTGRRGGRRADERGAVVVLAVGLVGLLLLVGFTCAGCVVIVLAHRRAEVAADLAALAGAAALQVGHDPCAAAARIAGLHRASVGACDVEGRTVVVTTSVRLTVPLAGDTVAARARAGPADVPG